MAITSFDAPLSQVKKAPAKPPAYASSKVELGVSHFSPFPHYIV